jgi:hypothetical protein
LAAPSKAISATAIFVTNSWLYVKILKSKDCYHDLDHATSTLPQRGPYSPQHRLPSISPMSKASKTLADILTGRSDANIGFADICHVLECAGFIRKPGQGSHTIFHKDGVEEIINLQPIGNNAKSYQVKQVRNPLLKYQPEID